VDAMLLMFRAFSVDELSSLRSLWCRCNCIHHRPWSPTYVVGVAPQISLNLHGGHNYIMYFTLARRVNYFLTKLHRLFDYELTTLTVYARNTLFENSL